MDDKELIEELWEDGRDIAVGVPKARVLEESKALLAARDKERDKKRDEELVEYAAKYIRNQNYSNVSWEGTTKESREYYIRQARWLIQSARASANKEGKE